MTSEQYAIIVDHALRRLGELSGRELRAIEPWLTKRHIDWARENKDPGLQRHDEIMKVLSETLDHLKAKYCL